MLSSGQEAGAAEVPGYNADAAESRRGSEKCAEHEIFPLELQWPARSRTNRRRRRNSTTRVTAEIALNLVR